MLEKTALSFYRTIVLTGVGFVAGAILGAYAYEKHYPQKPEELKNDAFGPIYPD